jgi:hypothetical protein
LSAGASSNQAKAEAAKATAHTAELSVEAEKARLEQDRIRQQNYLSILKRRGLMYLP